VSLSQVDLRSLPAAERETEVVRLASEQAQRRFDLAHGPLLRITVVHLEADVHLLLLSMHHIIFDGWSTGLFCRELTTLYTACTHDLPSPLPPLPLQYADFVIWQREWLQGEELSKQLAYWQQHLAGAPARLDLPSDHPHPLVPTMRGAAQPFALSQTLTEALKALSLQEGMTLYTTLLAAF
jgi:hypothetical protein